MLLAKHPPPAKEKCAHISAHIYAIAEFEAE